MTFNKAYDRLIAQFAALNNVECSTEAEYAELKISQKEARESIHRKLDQLLTIRKSRLGRIFPVVLLGLFTLGCGASTKDKHRAVEALRRLDEYKRAGEIFYEPRYRDAEIAVDEVPHFLTAYHCLSLIKINRILQRRLEITFEENKEPALICRSPRPCPRHTEVV